MRFVATLLGALGASGCLETPEEACRPTGGCPENVCGSFFDGCNTVECGCGPDLVCEESSCVDPCRARECGEVVGQDGQPRICGTCLLGLGCSADGLCSTCGVSEACAEGHPCLDAQLCSAVPGCLALLGRLGEGTAPPGEEVQDRSVAFEESGGDRWLWHAVDGPGAGWSLRRVKQVDGAFDFAGGTNVAGIFVPEGVGFELPPTITPGEELWALRIPDPAATAPQFFVRFELGEGGVWNEVGEQEAPPILRRVAPQVVDGHELALIGHLEHVAIWARRSVAADGSVTFTRDEALDTEVPGLKPRELIRYVQLACGQTRLLVWVNTPGEQQSRRLLEVELTIEGGAPRLGAGAELTALANGVDETAVATTPACDLFVGPYKTGLKAWRAAACE